MRGEAAPNVTVAGVDVGGLDREAAEEKVARELASRLAAPVQVTIGDEQVAVTPTALGIGLDIDRMVDERDGAPTAGRRARCRSSAAAPRCRSCSCRRTSRG